MKLPNKWKWSQLGDSSLFEVLLGSSPPGETYNKNGVGLPFIQGCTEFGLVNPTPVVWCSAPVRIAEPKDILFSVRAPVGPTNIANEKICIGRGIAAIRCKKVIFYKYLFWNLKFVEKQKLFIPTGSTFDAIGREDVEAIKIPLPPTFEEQKAIAERLEKAMSRIEAMRTAATEQKEAIEAMPGAVLRANFDFKE